MNRDGRSISTPRKARLGCAASRVRAATENALPNNHLTAKKPFAETLGPGPRKPLARSAILQPNCRSNSFAIQSP
jgi:hypothetical protein